MTFSGVGNRFTVPETVDGISRHLQVVPGSQMVMAADFAKRRKQQLIDAAKRTLDFFCAMAIGMASLLPPWRDVRRFPEPNNQKNRDDLKINDNDDNISKWLWDVCFFISKINWCLWCPSPFKLQLRRWCLWLGGSSQVADCLRCSIQQRLMIRNLKKNIDDIDAMMISILTSFKIKLLYQL